MPNITTNHAITTYTNACHTGYTACIKFELKFSIIHESELFDKAY